MRAYLRPWQLIPLAIFVLTAIIVGGAMLKRLLERQLAAVDAHAHAREAAPGARRKRRLSTARCVLSMLLAGMGGAFGAGAVFALFSSIDQTFHGGAETVGSFVIVGGVLAVPAMIGVAYLVILTMFPLPAGRVFRASAPVFAFVLVLAGVIGTPTGLLARHQRLRDLYQERTIRQNLPLIDQGLREYERLRDDVAPSLAVLAEEEFVEPRYLRSPADPDGDIGYFYMPRRSVRSNVETQAIRVCDYRDNFGGQGRGILLINGRTSWVSEEAFQQMLELEENREFAEALREIE